jgi:hypothetical protein
MFAHVGESSDTISHSTFAELMMPYMLRRSFDEYAKEMFDLFDPDRMSYSPVWLALVRMSPHLCCWQALDSYPARRFEIVLLKCSHTCRWPLPIRPSVRSM